jgi:transcriptional regulator NrdR family protein
MSDKAIDIVKRGGQRPSERFSRPKLHASIQAACLSIRSPEGAAESMATSVCDAVIIWLETKPEVTSGDIRRKAGDVLESYHPEAAYLYKHHRVVM